MGPQLRVRWTVAAAVTVVAYGAVVVITGFLACGVSGCSGGGFGPVFDPLAAQLGLLLAGAAVAPFAGMLLRGLRPARTVIGMLAAVAAGAVLAMLILGLGPDGCPSGFSRASSDEYAFSPGSPTCRAS